MYYISHYTTIQDNKEVYLKLSLKKW